MIKLDLGCGISKRAGYVGVDCLRLPGVDVVHDLNLFPYPFAEGEIDEIWMDQVLEHLAEPLKVMEEIYRIGRDDARITIGVPYFRSFYSVIDPTHKNFFGTMWFQYFNPEHHFFHKYQYSSAKFRLERIEFDREFRRSKGIIHKIMRYLAEERPHYYERKLSHLYPLSSLTFYLRVDKAENEKKV